MSPAQGAENHAEAVEKDRLGPDAMSPTLASFLSSLQLEHLIEVFEKEQITLEILAEMSHEDLKQVKFNFKNQIYNYIASFIKFLQVGITAYGFRHKILRGISILRSTSGFGLSPNPGTLLVDLLPDDKEFLTIEEEMQATIREHRDNNQTPYNRYIIIRVRIAKSLLILFKKIILSLYVTATKSSEQKVMGTLRT